MGKKHSTYCTTDNQYNAVDNSVGLVVEHLPWIKASHIYLCLWVVYILFLILHSKFQQLMCCALTLCLLDYYQVLYTNIYMIVLSKWHDQTSSV